jgi:trigger factor
MSTDSEKKAKEFKNERLKVEVHHKPNCVVEYEVRVEPAICLEAHKKAAKSVGKEVVLPGFRKGKAPPEMVAKRHPQEIDRRWQEEIANTAYKEAAALANVPLVSPDASITFKMHHHAKDGAHLTLTFETIPNIPTIDPAKCVLKEIERPEVSKEKVDETIRQVQMFFAKWEHVEDRTVEEGDFVLLDVDIIDKDPPQRLFSNIRFEVTDRTMAQWMKPLILGKKPGDISEGVSEPDPDLSEEEKKEYPPQKVRVEIKALEKVELPELNEEFAKQVGASSPEELREKIEKILTKKSDEHVKEEQREEVTRFLLSHPFEIPPSVVEKEARYRIEQMMRDPNFKTQWEQSKENERRDLIQNVKTQSEKAIRLYYLCRKISADQNITVAAKDLPMGQKDLLEILLFPSEGHDPEQPDVKQAESYSRILFEKTEDWVIAHARTASASKKEESPAKEKKQAQPEEEKSPKKKTASPITEEPPKKKTAAKKTAKDKAPATKSKPPKKS